MGNFLSNEHLKGETDSMDENVDIPDNHEEKYPLYPLASKEYQYKPLLAMILSYLDTPFLLGTICTVNSHFRYVVMNLTILNDLIANEKYFFSEAGEEGVTINPLFLETVLKKNIKTRCLSISYSIIGKIIENSLLKMSVDDSFDPVIPSFDLFSNHLVKVIILPISDPKFPSIDIDGVIFLLNTVSNLEHMIVHDFLPSSDQERKIKLNDSHRPIRILQLRCEDLINYSRYNSMEMHILMDNLAVELLEGCENLSVLELPRLFWKYFSHSIFKPKVEKKVTAGVGANNEPLVIKKLSLSEYVCKRYLFPYSNSYDISKNKNILDRYPLPLFSGPLSVDKGTTTNRKIAVQIHPGSFFLIDGIPFLMTCQWQGDAYFVEVISPYVKYTIRCPLKQYGFEDVPNTQADGFSAIHDSTFGGRFKYFKLLFRQDLDLSHLDFYSIVPKHLTPSQIPIHLTVHHVYHETEIHEAIKIVQDRDIEKKKVIVEDFGKKENEVIEMLFTRQKLMNAKDSCELVMDISKGVKLVGDCTQFFTLFDGLIQYKMDYRMNRGSNKRSFYIETFFPENLVVPMSYTAKLWFVYYDEDEEDAFQFRDNSTKEEEEDESEQEEFFHEFRTSKQYFRKRESDTWGFEFLMDPEREEKRVRFELTLEIMGEVLEIGHWEEIQKEYVKQFNDVPALSIINKIEDINNKIPRFEKKELVLFMENPDVAEQVGIRSVQQQKVKDPVTATLRLCGIDFSVEFLNFGYFNRVSNISLYFARILYFSTRLKIKGSMKVELMDEENDKVVIAETTEEFFDVDREVNIMDLCCVNRNRKIWKFNVSLVVREVSWVPAEK